MRGLMDWSCRRRHRDDQAGSPRYSLKLRAKLKHKLMFCQIVVSGRTLSAGLDQNSDASRFLSNNFIPSARIRIASGDT